MDTLEELEKTIKKELGECLHRHFPRVNGTCYFELNSKTFNVGDYEVVFNQLQKDKQFEIMHEINSIIESCKTHYMQRFGLTGI